jgi:hypothetical protein
MVPIKRRLRRWLGVDDDLAYVLEALTKVEEELHVTANKASYSLNKLNKLDKTSFSLDKLDMDHLIETATALLKAEASEE